MSTWIYMYMNVRCQGHSLTLVQGISDLTLSNPVSWETAKPTEAKFNVEPPCDRWRKVCSNGPGHKTSIAAISIHGNNLKNSYSLEPKWPMTLKVGRQHCVYKYYHVCSNYYGKVKFGPLCFLWEKEKQWTFQKLFYSMISKLVDAIN